MLSPIRIRLLEKIVRLIIVPKGGDKAALTDLVKIVMLCLLFRRPLDLSRLIMDMMRECAEKKKRALGYGKVITVLLRAKQFDFSPYRPMVLESPIDDDKVTAMTKGQKRQGGAVAGQAGEQVGAQGGGHAGTVAGGAGASGEAGTSAAGARGTAATGGEGVSLAGLQGVMLESFAEVGAQLAGLRGLGLDLRALEAKMSWLVASVVALARATGHEGVLPRRDFEEEPSVARVVEEPVADPMVEEPIREEPVVEGSVAEEVVREGTGAETSTVGEETEVERAETAVAEEQQVEEADAGRDETVVPEEEVRDATPIRDEQFMGPSEPMVVLRGPDGGIVVVPASEAPRDDA